jgi:hypothetical protein
VRLVAYDLDELRRKTHPPEKAERDTCLEKVLGKRAADSSFGAVFLDGNDSARLASGRENSDAVDRAHSMEAQYAAGDSVGFERIGRA